MVGWHHPLNEHEFEQVPGDSEGQGTLVGCSPRGCKESDTTEQLKKNMLETGNTDFSSLTIASQIRLTDIAIP